jgi:hypothetical protein
VLPDRACPRYRWVRDIRALDKLIGAYDDPDTGEDELGEIASTEQIADDPDHEGVLENLVPLLELGLSGRNAG